jgi:GcrA cell cycle regulator
MQLNWAPEHSDALREFHAKGGSFSEIAQAINARFRTAYSRCAVIGRAKRMGLRGRDELANLSKPPPKVQQPQPLKSRERDMTIRSIWPSPVLEKRTVPALRCVEIEPRHLSLVELQHGDCRYPYGGDEEGEAITFCGHPRRTASSYCTAHFHLTRGPGTATERAAIAVALRLVQAA